MNKVLDGYILGFSAIFMWSFNVIISKHLVDVLSPIQISFFRWLIASLFLLPFSYKIIWKNKKVLLFHWKLILILSSCLALMNNFVYQAGHTATAIDMSLIATTGPLFLIVISKFLFNIIISRNQIVGFFIALFGVLVVITDGKLTNLTEVHLVRGDFWMLLNAFTFGTYGALQKLRPKEIPPFILLSITAFVGTVILLPFFIYSFYYAPIAKLELPEISILFYLGIVNSILAYFFWNLSLDRLGNLKTSLMYYTIPLFSITESHFLLNEEIYPAQIGGALLILGGIIFSTIKKERLSS